MVGLTTDEAAARLAAEGPNELPTAKPRRLPQQAWDVATQPMLLLLVAAAAVSFVLAEPLEGIMLSASVLIVITVSIYQEHRTEQALAALRDLSSPRALVLRDGARVRIAGRDVVRGDLVLLAEGDRVPADATVVEGVNLAVDESALTGESVPVRKVAATPDTLDEQMGAPGGDATPWVFSGTLVVKGHGTALVRATAGGTELGRIGAALRTIEPERTRLQREVDRIVRVIALLGALVVMLIVVVYGSTRGDWLEGLLAGIAAAMAILPEEFAVVLTLFLALGAWRMSRWNVLTRRAPVVEMLGSATAICVDKTGTLTLNRMVVSSLVVDRAVHVVDRTPIPDRYHELVEFGMLASPVDPFDPMDRAFRELAESRLAAGQHLHVDREPVREYALSEELLALSFVWCNPDTDSFVVAAKGAPEAIADLCHLDAGARRALIDQVELVTAGGERVLAVARAGCRRQRDLPERQHDFEFQLLGLVGLRDPVRPGVADAVAQCARAGIRVIMITGDYPGTALAVAREIGMDTAPGCLTGPEVDEMTDERLATRMRTVSVFARMVPEQKLRLVRALQADGDVVGMTGDGVNDAPALRAADIGIAMGGRGTDVARESAALVVTDDDFTSIVRGIRQGRGIFDNLRKAMSYIVAIHVPIFGMALIPVFVSDWPLVLLPLQVALFELIIDPACSVVFEAEPVDPQVMERRPRGPREPMFGARTLTVVVLQGVAVLAAVLGVYLWTVLDGRPAAEVRSVTFTTLVVANLSLILVNRSWRLSAWRALRERRNPTVRWILGAAAVLLVLLLAVPALREAFNFGPMSMSDLLVALAAGSLSVVWFELYKLWTSGRTRAAYETT